MTRNRNMLKVFFRDITNGRLTRQSYLGYSLLLALFIIGFGLTIILAIGVGEQLIGGNLQQAQDKLREWLTFPFFIIFGLVSAGLKALVLGSVIPQSKKLTFLVGVRP